ncbi:MAG TPA: alpha/beta fold hydrolase [Allosphingosinicella sp.]
MAFALQGAPAQPVNNVQAAPPSATTVFELPRPTGKYPVGTYMAAVTDPDRREIFTADPADRRRVALQVYYPAAKGCAPQPYIPSALADTLVGMLRTEKGFERRLKAHACTDAKLAAGSEKYPLVLFSHGLGPSHFFYVSLLEDLASRGNIVVAIDHPHGSGATYFPDGPLVLRDGSRWGKGPEQSLAAGNEFFRNWAEDARSVLDRIFRNDGTVLPKELGKRVDPGRVAYMGHSYGGVSAIYAAQVDGRIKAALNLDGGVGTPAEYPRMLMPVATDVPLLVLNSENYDESQSYAKSVRLARLRGVSHGTFGDLLWFREKLVGTGAPPAGNAPPAGGNGPMPPANPLPAVEGIRLTRELSSLFLECAFTQNCARLDSALDAARVPADEKPAN